MLELTCKISTSRRRQAAWRPAVDAPATLGPIAVTELPALGRRLRHPRAVVAIVASTVGAIVILVALLTLLSLGGRGGMQPSLSVAMPNARASACLARSRSAGTRQGGSATHAPQVTLTGALDAALHAARARLHTPAATAAVVVCGRVVWADAIGDVDLRSARPVTNRSLFILNSAAKTFVATMVMQEIQHGHLSLNTRLSQFYPWLPNAGQVSVRMLLNMTSGLPDYLNNPRIEWMIRHRPRHRWTVDQVLTGLGTGLGPPRFRPGAEFQYSDTNYIALGGILERITHASIERDFQQLIAKPLAITSATFVPSPAAEALLAHPYLQNRNGSLASEWIPGFGVSSAVWGPVFTDGGLAMSSLDVARFANALLSGRLVSTTAVRQMTHIDRGDYGFGVRARSFDGHYWLGHRGYFDGFETEDWTDPSRLATIAVSTNLEILGSEPTSTGVWSAIARAYDHGLRTG